MSQALPETKMKESLFAACRGCVLHMKQGSFIVEERDQHMASSLASMAAMVDSFEFPRFTQLDPWNQIYIHILYYSYFIFAFSFISRVHRGNFLPRRPLSFGNPWHDYY